jgi:hypothetical protein
MSNGPPMAMAVLHLTEISLTAGRGAGAPELVVGGTEIVEIETGASEGGGLIFLFLHFYPLTDCFGYSVFQCQPGQQPSCL